MLKITRFLLIVAVLFSIPAAEAAKLKVSITPTAARTAGAQWRVDGGPWQASGATVNNLASGPHLVEGRTIQGWIAPEPRTVVLSSSSTSITINYTRAASVSIHLTGNIGRWQVDDGPWQNPGAVLGGLAAGSHWISYEVIPGYSAPVRESVTLVAGQALVQTRSYTALPAALKVDLHPEAGKYRVNGGAWNDSGATVSVPAGSYQIDYADVAGFSPPGPESVTLAPEQALSLVRTYTPTTGTLSVDLDLAAGRWTVDGATWHAGGESVVLEGGTYTLRYAPVDDWFAPPDETIVISAGEVTTLTRAYSSAVGWLTIDSNLGHAQWRVPGGAWNNVGLSVKLPVGEQQIEFSTVEDYVTPMSMTVTVTPGQSQSMLAYYEYAVGWLTIDSNLGHAQWRVPGGTWNGVGQSVKLPVGEQQIEFSTVEDYVTPMSMTVSVTPGQSQSMLAYYEYAVGWLTIDSNLGHAQWRVSGGTWNGVGLSVKLPVGEQQIEFSTVEDYATPMAMTVSVTPGQSQSMLAYYEYAVGWLTIDSNLGHAQWRVPGGAWSNVGLSVKLPVGEQQIEFSTVEDYVTPMAMTVSVTPGQSQSMLAYYEYAVGWLTIDSNLGHAQWRVSGGAWNNVGLSVKLPVGEQQIEFSTVEDYVTPMAMTVSVTPGQSQSMLAYYEYAVGWLTIDSNLGHAQWRVSGGTWNGVGLSVKLPVGEQQIEFSTVEDYVTPMAMTVSVTPGQSHSLFVFYEPSGASITLNLEPTSARWRVVPDGGAGEPGLWLGSGETAALLAPGSYRIEYEEIPGFLSPPAEMVELAGGEVLTLTRSYEAAPTFDILHEFFDTGGQITTTLGSDGRVYGASAYGAGFGAGSLFSVDPGTGQVTALHAFGYEPGGPLTTTRLIEGSDGILYGCSSGGGVAGLGTVYRIGRDGMGFAVLRSFVQTDLGTSPTTLLHASDGFLYGLTRSGSPAQVRIFRLATDGSGFAVLAALPTAYSRVDLNEAEDGFLYGTTSSGGVSSAGAVFRISKSGTGFTVIKNFAGGADGSAPYEGVVAGGDGWLYGTTRNGGASSRGTLFRLSLNGSTHQILHHFAGNATDGGYPTSRLELSSSGDLIGTTMAGGPINKGTLFRAARDGSGYTVLKVLSDDAIEGRWPQTQPHEASDGRILFSSSIYGGASDGALLSFQPVSGTTTLLQIWGAPGGALVFGPVAVAPGGDVVGTTYTGGVHGFGTLYRMGHDGTGFTVLHHFANGIDGSQPSSPLTVGSDGANYGTTSNGGAARRGSVFRASADGSSFTTIHEFAASPDGAGPQSVIQLADGTLLGATASGGSFDAGTLFRVNAMGGGYSVVRTFAGGVSDGASPGLRLIQGLDQRIYGTTTSGGSAGHGTLYAIQPDGSGFVILRHFLGGPVDGANPIAGLVQGPDGTLYGTTGTGGAHDLGTVFSIRPDGSGYALLHAFAGGSTDGAEPLWSGVTVRDGVLHGTTTHGGSFNKGVLFALGTDGAGFSILVNFGLDPSDAALPASGLVQSADGTLYGTSAYGAGGGTVFRLQTP